MSTYVLSDIHGRFDAFKTMLEKINFTDQDTLYVIGDVVDRGSEPIAALQYIMARDNIIMTLGNHEDLFLKGVNEDDWATWYHNGGAITHEQYLALSKTERKQIIDYVESLPIYIELDKYILIHAGIDKGFYGASQLDKPVTWESVKDIQGNNSVWVRDKFIYNPALTDKIVIFGHTPTLNLQPNIPAEIYFAEDKIGIDCGAAYPSHQGRLGCLNLDTLECYYVD